MVVIKPIKVVQIELTQPLPHLSGLEGYASVQGLVCKHGIPLAYVEVPVKEGSCSPTAIREALLRHPQLKSAELEKMLLLVSASRAQSGTTKRMTSTHEPNNEPNSSLDTHHEAPWPSVTVAVCTRDRPEDLQRCLDSLLNLDYACLELMVVDNAPNSDETERLVRQQYPQVRYIQELQPGLSAARNCAIRAAESEILAFTDDDVVVDRGWVRELSRVFRDHPEVMAVTGLIAPYELETEAQILFERRNGFGRGFQRHWVQVSTSPDQPIADTCFLTAQWGAGANMAFRRHFLAQEGGFALALGAGSPGQGGEDLEMFFRVLKGRYALVYEPKALVWHRHRRQLQKLNQQMLSYGIGSSFYCIYCARVYPEERWGILRQWLRVNWSWHMRRYLRSFVRTDEIPSSLILLEFWGSWLGLWQSLWIYPKR